MKVVHEIQDFKVPKGIEDHLFRITQEAISIHCVIQTVQK